MKKQLWFVLLLCIALLLTACTATDPNNLFETTQGNPADTTAATVETTESTEPSESSGNLNFDGSVMFEEGYQYGNMQKNIPSGDFMLLDNEVLFQFVSNGNFRLYSYSLETGKVRSYCKDATCAHKTCVAGNLLTNLEVYNREVYTLTRDYKIAKLKEGDKEILIDSRVRGFFHHNNKLYARSADSALVVITEEGQKPTIVIEEYTGHWEVIFGDYLYFNSSDGISRADLKAETINDELIVPNAGGITDGKHIYYIDNKSYFLYRCDMDGTDPQLLVDQPVLLASINFDDEYFYYRLFSEHKLVGTDECNNIYRFAKNDPSSLVKIATLDVPVFQIFTVPKTDRIFVLAYMMSNGECHDIFTMGTDGTNPTRLVIPEY